MLLVVGIMIIVYLTKLTIDQQRMKRNFHHQQQRGFDVLAQKREDPNPGQQDQNVT